MYASPLIAVDIGNARIKLGLFQNAGGEQWIEPTRTLALPGNDPEFGLVGPWLAGDADKAVAWRVASVNRSAAARWLDWFRTNRSGDAMMLLASGDLPLNVRLPRPDMVGIDRLVDAVAANHLRAADRPAVLVDVGSAITVDLVSADGSFRGGAILPGIQMAARALHDFTDLLPLIDASELNAAPSAVGTATESAMQSGLFWGAVGAIRELIERFREEEPETSPEVFLTGGAAATVAELLGPDARYVPNLTLSGIALSITNAY